MLTSPPLVTQPTHWLGGVDYQVGGGMDATLGDLNTSYRLFTNKDEIEVDYLVMGPGLLTESETHKATNLLISLPREERIVWLQSLHIERNVVGVNNTDTITDNILRYYSSLSSSLACL